VSDRFLSLERSTGSVDISRKSARNLASLARIGPFNKGYYFNASRRAPSAGSQAVLRGANPEY